MPIIYALVARGSRVQVEYAATTGNFASIARKILERVQSEGNEPRRSYQFDGHMFHIIVDEELVFLCMCDSEFGRVLPFQFLGEIRKRWRASRGENLTISFAGGNAFESVLREQIEKYSGGGPSSSNEPDLEGMQGQLGNIKSVMVDNIDKVLDRGEKLSLLVDRSENLHQQAFKFSKASTNFKRQMWLKNMKMAAMLGGLVLGVFYLFAATFCGGLLLRTCRRAAR